MAGSYHRSHIFERQQAHEKLLDEFWREAGLAYQAVAAEADRRCWVRQLLPGYNERMARAEIAEKIQALLTTSEGWSKATVVYFLVEVRKLLDHQREQEQRDHAHLRFYCDWIVHISKDRTDPAAVDVLRTVQKEIEAQLRVASQIAARGAVDFAYFESMRRELLEFLSGQGLEVRRIQDGERWPEFISFMVKVLENQPLTVDRRHGLHITKITFLPSAPRCVILLVEFRTPIASSTGEEYHWFKLGNAY